jgi:hypothetical protein
MDMNARSNEAHVDDREEQDARIIDRRDELIRRLERAWERALGELFAEPKAA